MSNKIQTIIKDGILVVTPQINMLEEGPAGQILDLFKKSVQAGTKEIVLNLGKVGFMNSAGLNQLLLCAARLNAAGGELTLCNLTEQTRRLLRMASLQNIFNELPDEEAAIEYSKTVRQRLDH